MLNVCYQHQRTVVEQSLRKIEGFKIDLKANNAIKSTEIGDVEESRDAYATINTLLPNVNN